MKLRYTLAALALAATLYGDEPKVFKPTEVQSLRLQVRHKDAELSLMQLQTAQKQYQAAMAELVAEGERVKTEQHWDSKVTFDPNTLQFAEPAPVKAEVKKP